MNCQPKPESIRYLLLIDRVPDDNLVDVTVQP